MAVCENCGVELKPGSESCPLCGMPLGGEKPPKKGEVERPSPKTLTNTPDLGHWLWELFTFLAAAGFIVVFTVDFAFGMTISWSKIPLISITYLWLAVTLPVKLRGKIFLLLLIEFIILMVFLGLLDLLIAGKPWFYGFVLPFLFISGLILEVTIALILKLRLRQLTVIAVSVISLGIFLLCLEAVLSSFLFESIRVSWSLVACACLVPISGFILYLKERIRKKSRDLKKYFHT